MVVFLVSALAAACLIGLAVLLTTTKPRNDGWFAYGPNVRVKRQRRWRFGSQQTLWDRGRRHRAR